MKRKGCSAIILGMVLAAGVFLAGCDLTTDPDNKGKSNTGKNDGSGTSNSGELDGTWKQGSYELIINGDNYVMKASGEFYGKGAISYSIANSTFTFRSTHEWTGSGWSPFSETTKGTIAYSGNTLVISNLNNYTFLAGSWTKQTGGGTGNANQKTIIVTDFPESNHKGEVAMVLLFPSVTNFEEREDPTAIGGVKVDGATLTFSLCRDVDLTTRWNGTGDYIIILALTSTGEKIEEMFIYSNGEEIDPDSPDAPMYSITETTSTIPFDKFWDVTEMIPAGMIPEGK
jgi:hypothetical protein